MSEFFNYLKRFTYWQNYAHYLLLSIGVVMMLKYGWLYVNKAAFTNVPIVDQILMFAYAALVIDTIVHLIFWFAPVPYRWRE